MARRAAQFATFTKGELDPDLSERVDLEHYYDSLAKAENCVFHPQGGFSDRGGFELCSDADIIAQGLERRLRRRVLPVPITADNLTAINGGSTVNLVDQNAATGLVSNAVTADQFVLVEVDLGQVQTIDLVDIFGFKAELAGADEALAVEWYDGSQWRAFGDAIGVPARKHIKTSVRTRRFGVTPGNGVETRNIRLVIYGGASLCGQITVAGLRIWTETAAIGQVRVREIARDKATTYQVVIGERGADIYRRQRYVASVPLPIAWSQVPELSFAGGFDTKMIFNEMIESPRIVRQGADGEWNVDAVPYTNVPTLIESVLFSGAQDEIQDLDLTGIATGQHLVLMLGDQICPAILVPDLVDLAAAIRAALVTLPGIANAAAGDLKVERQGTPPTSTWRVRFSGGNGNRAWPLLAAYVSELPAVFVPTAIVQAGLKPDGKYFEAATGWPRTGTITQQRLLLAGFRAAPTAYRFSKVPALFDFASGGDPLTADQGFGGALDVDDVEIINEVFVGSHLQLFTETGEWWAETRKADATQPINFIRASGNGMKRGVPVVFADGATQFMQQGGATLREFIFTEENKYQTEPLSVLSPQVFADVADVAHKAARTVAEGNLVIVANANGTAGAVTMLRKQNVIAGAPWTTAGSFRSVMASIDHEIYAVIERNGNQWLERRVPDRPLDWATRDVATVARTVITSAAYLDGRTDVWAIADDDLIGPLTVSGGSFTLPVAALDVTYGLMPAFAVRSQVLRDKLSNAQPFRAPGRIYEMELALKDTGGLFLGTNGAPHNEVVLTRTDSANHRGGPLQTETGGAPQLPMYRRLYTGDVVLQGLLGISHYPYWEISRTAPVPVHVKRIRLEAADKGDNSGG